MTAAVESTAGIDQVGETAFVPIVEADPSVSAGRGKRRKPPGPGQTMTLPGRATTPRRPGHLPRNNRARQSMTRPSRIATTPGQTAIRHRPDHRRPQSGRADQTTTRPSPTVFQQRPDAAPSLDHKPPWLGQTTMRPSTARPRPPSRIVTPPGQTAIRHRPGRRRPRSGRADQTGGPAGPRRGSVPATGQPTHRRLTALQPAVQDRATTDSESATRSASNEPGG